MKRNLLIAAAAAALVLASPETSDASARYAAIVQEELQKLGLQPQCEDVSTTRHRCSFPVRSSLTHRTLTGQAVYDEASATVYVYVERLISLPASSADRTVVLQRLMELNWELLVGKFEWNPKSGEVRLSSVLCTDSNFDRRAFRSVVLSLDTLAARYHGELSSLRSIE